MEINFHIFLITFTIILQPNYMFESFNLDIITYNIYYILYIYGYT